MGALTLIHGPAHPDKWGAPYARCLERLQTSSGADFLWIFPSRFQARLMRRRLLAAGGPAPVVGHLALDLDHFVAALYTLCPDGNSPLPPCAHRLLVEDALAACAETTPYFSRRSAGLGQGLTRLFRTLEETGTRPENLSRDTQRGAELHALYTAYLERLAAGWTGSAGRFDALSRHLDSWIFNRLFPGVDLLVLCGFTALPTPFLPVLDTLLAILPESIALLDYDESRPQLFSRVRPLYEFLSQRASRSSSFQPPPSHHPAAQLEPLLFTRSQADLESPVTRLACTDRLDEVAAIARHIRRLHQAQQVDLAQIRVSFRNLDRYAPLVEEVLPRHGLPFHFSRGRPLSSTPVVGTVLALLDLVLERYSRPALLRLLCLPWICLRFPFEGRQIELSAAAFDAWARNLPPTTGRRGWLEAIGGRTAYLERELSRDDGLVSEEIDDPQAWRDALRDDLAALRPLQSGIEALFALVQPLERRQTLPSFRRHLLHALGELGLLKSLESGGAEDGIALSRLVELLDELCAPDAARHPFAPGELSDLLRDALSSTYLPVPNYSGVQITDLGASGGAPCDYLFLGGLVQGEFPRLTPGDIFIDETQRQHLGLDERAETETERLLFYQTVCTPRRGLYILYPQRSGTEILSPSPFVEELDNLLTERPATADDDTPFTAADLHFALGRGLGRASDSAEASRALELYRRAASHPSHRPALRRLLRGLQVTCQRSHPAGLGPYEGVLDESEVLAGLRSRLGPGHAFSTTQLETYGRCPFRFFAKRLLGIEALVDPEADYTALERGNLVHRILYHFYAANGEAAEREENLPQGLVQLRRIAREQAADMRLEGFFWERELDRLLGAADGLGREGVLTRFLRLRVASADPAVPAHFELSFGSYPGLGPRDPHSTNTPYIIGDAESGDEVRIFGKIDRVDRTADGRFIVFDYKTGRQPRVAEIKEGLNLQLPLYLLAVETLLGEAGLNEGAGAAYLLLRDLENCGRRGLLANASHRDTAYVARGRQGLYDHEDFRQLLDAVRGYVLRYARAMRAGIFHVTRHNPATTCSGCPYAQSCRLDPRRMRILDRENQLP